MARWDRRNQRLVALQMQSGTVDELTAHARGVRRRLQLAAGVLLFGGVVCAVLVRTVTAKAAVLVSVLIYVVPALRWSVRRRRPGDGTAGNE